MTKPEIPKKIPKKRTKRINPGIPVVPEKKPDYIPKPVRIKEPVEVSYAPYTSNTKTCYSPLLLYSLNKKEAISNKINLSDLL